MRRTCTAFILRVKAFNQVPEKVRTDNDGKIWMMVMNERK